MVSKKKPDTKYEPDETKRRFTAILRGALHTPPIPNEDIPKLAAKAKARAKTPRPRKASAVSKGAKSR